MGAMRTMPAPTCVICGGAGRPRYVALRDRLFGALGEWALAECARGECGLLWLDPMS